MKGKRKLSILLLLIFVAVLFSACSSKTNDSSSDIEKKSSYNYDTATEAQESYGKEDTGSSEGFVSPELADSADAEYTTSNSVSTNRKLIRQISMDIETLEFDETLDFIKKQVNLDGGYIEKSNIGGNGYEDTRKKYANLVIRIPSTKVDDFIGLVDQNSYVINEDESQKDITLDYVDNESHVKTLKIEQERLLALLDKADKIEDIISLEDRLSDVRYELENYESRLRTYDNLVEYSTITLSISEVVKITKPVVKTKSALDRMGSGLKNTLTNIRDGFVNFIVWLVINGPYLVIWIAVILVIGSVSLRLYKKYNEKSSAMEEKQKQDSNNNQSSKETDQK